VPIIVDFANNAAGFTEEMRGREKEGYEIRDFGLLLIRFIQNYR
jgi:hypothetical protein